MNTKFKNNLFKLICLSFLFAIIIVSCKEETIENIHEQEHLNDAIKHFSIDELPHLNKVLESVSTNQTSKTANTTFGDLNLSDIIEYVNEDGKESYSFKIENPTNIESPIEFENLHLIKLPNDDGYLAFILRWKPNLDWYSENNYSFELYNFSGTVDRFDLDYNFLKETVFVNGVIQGGESNKTSTYSKSVEIICEDSVECTCNSDPYYCGCSSPWCDYVYETGCSVGGGGGGGGDDTSSGGTTGGTGTHISGGGSGTNTSTGDYVPNGNGGVVAIPPTKAETLSLYLGVELTEEQIAWANDDLNRVEYNLLIDYLGTCNTFISDKNPTEDCETKKEFGALALEALLEGDEVDYVQKIIIDDTFKNNPKIQCVYDKLMAIEDSYFKNIIEDMFESSKESHLFFKVANLTGNDAYTTPANLSNGSRGYQIEVDPAFIANSSILVIAQTLIHEIMHAEMIERLVQLGIIEITEDYDVEFITAEYSIYNGIQDLENQAITIYTEKFAQNEQWAHELFNLEFYRQELELNIIEFHESYNDASFNAQVTAMGWELFGNDGIYSALSWNGLFGTTEFEDFDGPYRDFIIQQIVFTLDNSNPNCN